jgi:hypothetical protein
VSRWIKRKLIHKKKNYKLQAGHVGDGESSITVVELSINMLENAREAL